MTITASLSNHDNIMAAVLLGAQNSTYVNALQGSKTRTIPNFADDIKTPYLVVGDGQFKGWASYPALMPTQGTANARLRGGVGRIFVWDFTCLLIYDYKPDATRDTTIQNAKIDLLKLEQAFQQNPQLLDLNSNITCEDSKPYQLESVAASKYGINISGRPLWLARLVVQAMERQGVTY